MNLTAAYTVKCRILRIVGRFLASARRGGAICREWRIGVPRNPNGGGWNDCGISPPLVKCFALPEGNAREKSAAQGRVDGLPRTASRENPMNP